MADPDLKDTTHKGPSKGDDFIILTGNSNPELARKIAALLKKDFYNPVTVFSDGEVRVRIQPNLRRRHVYIIQPTCPPKGNDYIMELILMIDAARRASSSEIIAVIPYFGYQRQDRKEMPRVPISSSAIARMLENAGANRIVTIDLHAEQEEGFAQGPWDNLYASYSLIPKIKEKKLKDVVIASPDKGGVVRATAYAKLLNASGIAIVYKQRDISVNDVSHSQVLIGDVKGKDVLLVDDIISTGGTILNAGNYIKQNGARSVRAAVTHALFMGDSLKKIEESSIEEFFVTDTTPIRPEVLKAKKINFVSVAPLLAEAIKKIETGESLSSALFLKT